jgi:hypothetical protein
VTYLASWKDLQAEFLQYAAEHANLRAVWRWIYEDPVESVEPPDPKGRWTLEGGSSGSQHLFRVIAGRAATRLSNPSDAEPWRLWLDRLRAEGYTRELPPDRVPTQHIRNLGGSGKILVPVPPGFEDQQIEHVFKASADFCFAHPLAEVTPPLTQPTHETGGESGVSGADGPISRSTHEGTEIAVSPRPDAGEAHVRAIEESSIPGASQPDGSLDFASEVQRNSALAAYTKHWNCPEAALARTSKVDPADLSRWKKGVLPAESDKRARIEKALKNNEPPTPAATRSKDF